MIDAKKSCLVSSRSRPDSDGRKSQFSAHICNHNTVSVVIIVLGGVTFEGNKWCFWDITFKCTVCIGLRRQEHSQIDRSLQASQNWWLVSGQNWFKPSKLGPARCVSKYVPVSLYKRGSYLPITICCPTSLAWRRRQQPHWWQSEQKVPAILGLVKGRYPRYKTSYQKFLPVGETDWSSPDMCASLWGKVLTTCWGFSWHHNISKGAPPLEVNPSCLLPPPFFPASFHP